MKTKELLSEQERVQLLDVARTALLTAVAMIVVGLLVGLVTAAVTVSALHGGLTNTWVIRGVWLVAGLTGLPALLTAPMLLLVALRALRMKHRGRPVVSDLEMSRMSGMGLMGLMLGYAAGGEVVRLAGL